MKVLMRRLTGVLGTHRLAVGEGAGQRPWHGSRHPQLGHLRWCSESRRRPLQLFGDLRRVRLDHFDLLWATAVDTS